MHRHRPSRMTATALATLLAVGCSGPDGGTLQHNESPTFGPHEGPVAALPGGGMFEVVVDAKARRSKLVAYFYSSGTMNAPLAPPPTDVRIDLAKPGNETVSVPMSAGGADRFVSAAGDIAFDPLIGTLKANVGGQAISVPFSGASR